MTLPTQQELPNVQNFHAFTVSFIGATDTEPHRIKIKSERFKQSVIFSYDDEYSSTKWNAIAWLMWKGFEITGSAEAKDCYIIFSTTFKPLKGK